MSSQAVADLEHLFGGSFEGVSHLARSIEEFVNPSFNEDPDSDLFNNTIDFVEGFVLGSINNGESE